MTWGRQAMSGAGGEGKVVNVMATGSVDQSVKVSLITSVLVLVVERR